MAHTFRTWTTRTLDETAMIQEFNDFQASERAEFGISYSGSLGQLSQSVINANPGKAKRTIAEAETYLAKLCTTGGPALAIRTNEPKGWVVGGWCRS